MSEKSSKTGRSTIMFDEEDLDKMIDALHKVKARCDQSNDLDSVEL